MKIILAKHGVQELISYANSIIKTDGEFFSTVPNNIKAQGALAVIKKISESNYFSVCEVDNLCKLHNIHMQSEHKQFLSTMHCVEWSEMQTETKEYIMALLVKYFEGPLTKM